jgi:hypothetical protein
MALSLTDQQENKLRPTGDHQQAELMLEYVERRLDEINESASRLSLLLKNLDNNISLVLQSSRLKLQNLELQVSFNSIPVALVSPTLNLTHDHRLRLVLSRLHQELQLRVSLDRI